MERVLILGREEGVAGTPRPVATDAGGRLQVDVAAILVDSDVRIVDDAGDSCMDNVNDALQVNVVAGGAGGGPVTIADGADVTQGALADVEVAVAGPASVIAILKRIRTLLGFGAVTGGGVEATALRVTIASDSTGLLSVDDNGGSLTSDVPDGSNVVEGATADAAVVTDVAGTLSGKLRGLVKWAFERMPASLGQKTKAASLPVTLASDEDALAVTGTFFQGTQPVSVADGSDVAEGATADAAVVTDVAGTISGKLRGLVKWAFERMPASLGQGTMAQSLPVVLASDQTDVSVATDGDTIWQTPTITAGAYAANDAVGGLLTFANAARVSGGGGVIKDTLFIDDAGQDAELELWLFRETFVAMADNAPWAPSEADLRKLVAIICTCDGKWFAAGTASAARVEVSQRYDLVATSMFGQLVTRGTPTFAATDDVTAIIGLLQD